MHRYTIITTPIIHTYIIMPQPVVDTGMVIKEHSQLTAAVLDFESHMVNVFCKNM